MRYFTWAMSAGGAIAAENRDMAEMIADSLAEQARESIVLVEVSREVYEHVSREEDPPEIQLDMMVTRLGYWKSQVADAVTVEGRRFAQAMVDQFREEIAWMEGVEVSHGS